jgi:hypothetical protein
MKAKNTLPGFTADASLHKGYHFGKSINTSSQDNAESVQPATIGVYGCFWLGVRRQVAVHSGDDLLVSFIDGIARGAGC